MPKKPKFKPNITKVKLNPEQAVLACGCWDTMRAWEYFPYRKSGIMSPSVEDPGYGDYSTLQQYYACFQTFRSNTTYFAKYYSDNRKGWGWFLKNSAASS